MVKVFDVEANSIKNLTKAGTPLLIGFSNIKTTVLEVMFITVRLCGIMGEPVRECVFNDIVYTHGVLVVKSCDCW